MTESAFEPTTDAEAKPAENEHGLRYSTYEIQDRVRAHRKDAGADIVSEHVHRAFRLGAMVDPED